MNKTNHLTKQALLWMYELSLSISKSLDLVVDCEGFVKTLILRKNFSYAEVFIKNKYLPNEEDEDWATLVYAYPMAKGGEKRIKLDHPIFSLLKGNKVLLISSDDDTFAQLVVSKKRITKGELIIFALGNIGVLKLFSKTKRPIAEINQLETLIPKFTISLEGCLSYQQVVKEITKRKQTEEKLLLYKFMVDSAHDAIFFKDIQSRYIIANQKALEAFGLSEQEVIGKNDYELMPIAKEAKKNVDDDQLVFKTKKPTKITKHMTAVDGSERWFQAIKVPQFDDKGNIIGLVGIARDITEQKLMEEELKRHRDYLSELVEEKTWQLKAAQAQLIQSERLSAAVQVASCAAHEVKNPLTIIKACVYYLKRILPENDEEAQKTLTQIDNATQKAITYINDLLNFSRPPVLHLKKVNINYVIEDSINELQQEILAGIEIEKNISSALPLLNADPDRLKQVIINLVKNACESMKEVRNKKLKVETKKDGDFIKISISDTGKGIPEENLPCIFEPFFTTKDKGTGLGLAICQHIIQAHKGTIEVKSKVGKGTIFEVKLPEITP